MFDREISSESISNIIVDFADTDGQNLSFNIVWCILHAVNVYSETAKAKRNREQMEGRECNEYWI